MKHLLGRAGHAPLVLVLFSFLIPTPASLKGQVSDRVSLAERLVEAERLTDEVGLLYRAGRYSEAIPVAERALAIREELLGPENSDVAESVNDLAVLYEAQGRYAEAEPLYERALALFEATLGPEHPEVATSLSNLALLYMAQGRYAEAGSLHDRAVASQWQVDDASTAAIIGAFFTAIAEAERASERVDYGRALRDAKLAVRNDPITPSGGTPTTGLRSC